MADEMMTTDALQRVMVAMRPRLHRYCARMIGSAIDGEDLVQDALAKAALAWPEAGVVERPEAWLFRIAHNAALDALRRRKRAAAFDADIAWEELPDETEAADARVAVTAGLAHFMHLPPAQRSTVVLVDVLGDSLAETAEALGMTVAAVKAALHRGRARLRLHRDDPAPACRPDPVERARLHAYADLFNARDFDSLRALLAEDVRLELVNRLKLAGKDRVGLYFTRYAEGADWHFTPALAEGHPALLVSDPADPSRTPRYLVLLEWRTGEVALIRDFRFAPTVMEGLETAPF